MSETLYGGIAETMLEAIDAGSYREGERIPSIRSLSKRLGVSVNTVKEAYSLLETQRYIEGRPQSGFFVRRKALPLPRATRDIPESLDPMKMSMCRIMGPYQERSENAGFLMSLANIDPALLPEKQLTAHLVEQTRIVGARSLEYQFLPGDRGLREQIARLGVDAGIACGPDEVLITNGCSEAFHLAIQAVCRPGDLIALESPTYQNFGLLVRELGLRVLEIPSDPQDGINIEILRFALKHHEIKAVLMVSNYSNPLGSIIPEDGKRELVELMEEHRVPLIEDDVFGDICFGPRRPGTCKAHDRTGNVIYCSSFSKSLAAGWRIGWILGGKYHERIIQLKSLFSLTTSSVTQKAIAAFLREESYEKHLRRLRSNLARQMGCLQEAVAEAFPEGTRTSRPRGGLALWVELPAGTDSLELYHRGMEAGIGFTPGPVFSVSGRFENFIRLCAGFWNPEIAETVTRLGKMAKAMKKSG
ncbi:MAG: hypothetical protein A2Z99_14790 [Treponema sp. GWB1_62_6]|nr:MAG: hypothetical protein A2Y36_12660 [Treponema sp. GWA1_62_8]OHE72159.1 MAG: hypothetical protein A2Z99_14790 [Treponema sp. GWB1_62_6]OHE75789.1 MAG: hypothetical protein A2413_06205 [Treponema sp. RIFOXYC1_FULL_61_9]